MTSPSRARPVLLVGSVPLSSAVEVFEAVGSHIGALVKRIPDGETGERLAWIGYQGGKLRSVAGLQLVAEIPLVGGPVPQVFPLFALEKGITAADLKFRPLGYAASAAQSYANFKELRAQGKIPTGTRFQVSLPTPLAVSFAFFVAEVFREIWPAYERAMIQEVTDIAAAIPHEDLAIQWDAAVETEISDSPEFLKKFAPRSYELAKTLTREEFVAAIARLADSIESDIELGIHLCYGDPDGKHVLQPKDAGVMVDLANRLSKAIRRPITWLHMPVPQDRGDDDYFAPLADLRLPPRTELYLGLVHLADDVEGAQRRIAAAQRRVPTFGIATECGLGRKPPESIRTLLDLHREISQLQ